MEEKKLQVMEVTEGAPVPVRDEAAEKIERLRALGLTKAAAVVDQEAGKIKEADALKQKLMIAYEFYRVITPEKIAEFNRILRKKTEKPMKSNGLGSVLGGGTTYDRLVFVALKDYSKVPPDHVLESLETAKGRGCFDSFEVGVLETVEVRPDPLLIGRVRGSEDRFFLDQWDNDVRIEDILKENEG